MKPWIPSDWLEAYEFISQCRYCSNEFDCKKLEMKPGEPVPGWRTDERGTPVCDDYDYDYR